MQYYLVQKGQRAGPFSAAELARHGVERHTLVWATGMKDWQRAETVAELQPLFDALPPPLPPGLTSPPSSLTIATEHSQHDVSAEKPAWNPEWIAWLGLLFTPLWTAIMAAVNARRLGMNAPWYRPIGIVVAWFFFDLLMFRWIGESWWYSMISLTANLFVLWAVDLEPQAQVYRARQRPSAGAWGPCLAGAPLGFLTILGLVIVPLLPLQPRQVCERLMQADSEAEIKKYATPRLWPAMSAALKLDDNTPMEFELTNDAEVAAEYGGGHIVGYAAIFTTPQGKSTMEGELQLIESGDEWKVNEMFITTMDGEALSTPFAFSSSYQQVLQAQRTFEAGKAAKAKFMEDARKNTIGSWWRNATGSWKGLFGTIGMLVFIFGGLFRSLNKGDTHGK